MYVCLCAGITDTTIKNAIADGCRSLKELKNQTGAMSQCCKCCGQCKEILLEITKEKTIDEECP